FLRANTERGATLASTARPNFTAIRTASWLSTGNTPGYARSTRLACEFGFAPYAVALPEKILDWVASCAWISRPMTVSQPEVLLLTTAPPSGRLRECACASRFPSGRHAPR